MSESLKCRRQGLIQRTVESTMRMLCVFGAQKVYPHIATAASRIQKYRLRSYTRTLSARPSSEAIPEQSKQVTVVH